MVVLFLFLPGHDPQRKGSYFLQPELVLKDRFRHTQWKPACVFHNFARTNTLPFSAAKVHLKVDDVKE